MALDPYFKLPSLSELKELSMMDRLRSRVGCSLP